MYNFVVDTVTLKQLKKYQYEVGNIVEGIDFRGITRKMSELILDVFVLRDRVKKEEQAAEGLAKDALNAKQRGLKSFLNSAYGQTMMKVGVCFFLKNAHFSFLSLSL